MEKEEVFEKIINIKWPTIIWGAITSIIMTTAWLLWEYAAGVDSACYLWTATISLEEGGEKNQFSGKS